MTSQNPSAITALRPLTIDAASTTHGSTHKVDRQGHQWSSGPWKHPAPVREAKSLPLSILFIGMTVTCLAIACGSAWLSSIGDPEVIRAMISPAQIWPF